MIDGYSNKSGKFVSNGCAAYYETDIVFKIFPTLKDKRDKDGLIYLKDLFEDFDYLGQGIFKCKKNNLSIFSHQYFRRTLSRQNSFNVPFLERFIGLHLRDNVNGRLAIDESLIGLASSFHLRQELAYHYGPDYNDDIESIRPDVTRFESSDRQKFFSGISGMEFWWKNDENTKVLEAEELRDIPSRGVSDDQYGCRYVHSIYDAEQKDFDHFDGAIRMYNTESMLERLGKAINKAGKHSQYTKIFRIDKKLKLENWKSLITDYFQDNPLTYEYFDRKKEYDDLELEAMPPEKPTILEKYVPYKMEISQGVRLFLSYHKPTPIDREFVRIVINPDFITGDENAVDAVELWTIEIRKALNRIGEELTIPDHFEYVNILDDYANFPTILHSSQNLERNLQKTLEAFRLLLVAMCRKRDMTIAFTLAFTMADKEARLSVFGKASQIVLWLMQTSTIPVERMKFRNWLVSQRVWLSEKYGSQVSRLDIFELVRSDGVMFICRRPIPFEWVEFNESEMGLKCSITFPEDEKELQRALMDNVVNAALTYIVKKVSCSKSGENYILSQTSKILDDDVVAIIEDVSSIGAYWTG